jgi:hypothetical protein
MVFFRMSLRADQLLAGDFVWRGDESEFADVLAQPYYHWSGNISFTVRSTRTVRNASLHAHTVITVWRKQVYA